MEKVAEGVWQVTGGIPRRCMNAYLIEGADGVTVFDTGIRQMGKQIIAGASKLGPIKQIVLGHSHSDHRGSARKIVQATGCEVWCHEAEKSDAEGDGGVARMHLDLMKGYEHFVYQQILFKFWDGGAVKIDRTLQEGNKVGDFTVLHMPGHAPGLISLVREGDGLALCSDVVYMINPMTGSDAPPQRPAACFSEDIDAAREGILKLADIEPSAVWGGHGKPITANSKQELTAAADRGV